MSTIAKEVTFYGLNQDMWWKICLLLRPDDLLSLSKTATFFAAFLNNQERRAAYFLAKASTEHLPKQPAEDSRTPFEFFSTEYQRHYMKPYAGKHPELYEIMRLVAEGNSQEATKKLDAYVQSKGAGWAAELRDASKNFNSLFQLIAAKQDWVVFQHLYIVHQYPLHFTFHAKYSILSYSLFFGWSEAVSWILSRDNYQPTMEDLRASIEGPSKDPALFKTILDRFDLTALEEVLQLAFFTLEARKYPFLNPLYQYADAHLTPGFKPYVLEEIKKRKRFDLYHHFHMAESGTESAVKKEYPSASRVLAGQLPSTSLKVSYVANSPDEQDWGLLRIASLQAPRHKTLVLVQGLIQNPVYHFESDFAEGRLIAEVLAAPELHLGLARILIDASSRYFDVIDKKYGQKANIDYNRLLVTLLTQVSQRISVEDTRALAKQMIRRWGPRLQLLFSGPLKVQNSLFGLLTQADLNELEAYYKGVVKIIEALKEFAPKKLIHLSRELRPVFQDLEKDLRSGIPCAIPLLPFYLEMLNDVQDANLHNASLSPREATFKIVKGRKLESLTPENLVEHLIRLDDINYRTFIGKYFSINSDALKVLLENPAWQTVGTLLLLSERYMTYESRKDESRQKVEKLRVALDQVKKEFATRLNDATPQTLFDCLHFQGGALYRALYMRRDARLGKPARGFDTILKCFPGLVAFIEQNKSDPSTYILPDMPASSATVLTPTALRLHRPVAQVNDLEKSASRMFSSKSEPKAIPGRRTSGLVMLDDEAEATSNMSDGSTKASSI